MQRCDETSAADWLTSRATPPTQLATFGPSGFEAYARLRFVPDPEFADQPEGDIQLPSAHPSDVESARRALTHLARFTDTPDECYFCVWDGYSTPEDQTSLEGAPTVAFPHRRYALFTGRLDDIRHWEETGTIGSSFPPAFVWPADRRWCFTSDVDPHWAGIAAERAAIETLIAATDIDAVRADPGVLPASFA